ncbi:hypothetical protein LTR37_010207 [Vermiconidia calcicola]|uniref:Uncharacterized protein n=1 Tax=Vermiconidia calcicola TaxID=1690605 RepID=A0ACC3N5J1_9PEZI|nr:hypothetical protein LTR37_010207 [Vermiconidia calcicola]
MSTDTSFTDGELRKKYHQPFFSDCICRSHAIHRCRPCYDEFVPGGRDHGLLDPSLLGSQTADQYISMKRWMYRNSGDWRVQYNSPPLHPNANGVLAAGARLTESVVSAAMTAGALSVRVPALCALDERVEAGAVMYVPRKQYDVCVWIGEVDMTFDVRVPNVRVGELLDDFVRVEPGEQRKGRVMVKRWDEEGFVAEYVLGDLDVTVGELVQDVQRYGKHLVLGFLDA